MDGQLGGRPAAAGCRVRSVKWLGVPGLQSSFAGRSVFFRGLFVGEFQFRQMGFHLIRRGPAQHVEAEHLVRPFRGLAARPEGDQQAGDDRAVGLNLDAVLVVTQQVAAAQQMLELSEAATGG